MIFTGIKRKSNQLFFNKIIKEPNAATSISSSNKIKKAFILLDDITLKQEVISNLKASLGLKENAIEIVIFVQKKAKDTNESSIFSSKDFGWYGKIKNEDLKNILTKKYDLLINYYKVENIYVNLLLLQCKATFKVGFASLDKVLYNLVVDCNVENYKLYNEEIKKYLTILNKL